MSGPGQAVPPPEAEGAASYRRLMSSGQFNQGEVDQWKADQTETLRRGGFTPEDIGKYWGDKNPSPAGTDRLARDGIGSLSPDGKQTVAEDPMSAFAAGLQTSDLGLLVHGKPTTVMPENSGLFNQIAAATGQTLGDLPFSIAGWYGGAYAGGAAGAAVPGGGETGLSEAAGAAVGGGFGSAALPQAVREAMLDYYNKGDVHDWHDFFSVLSGSLMRTLKAGTVGAIMSPAGEGAASVAGRLGANTFTKGMANMGTQVVTGTAVGGALDGHVPNAADFITASVLMLGIHAGTTVAGKFVPSPEASHMAHNLERIYAERGVAPWDAIRQAKTDPAWQRDIMAQDAAGEPVHPAINAASPSEPTPYHVAPEPAGEPSAVAGGSAEVTPFKTNPMRLQQEHDLDVANAIRGAHVAVDVQGMLPLVRRLESSGDQAISPAGAVGRYQIMPATARAYGFDPARLSDPAYNERAATAILSDLHHRYNGNVDDILVAYNAGPGRANRWIAGGRHMDALPTETQKYLEHSDRLNGWHGEPKPEMDDKGNPVLAPEPPPVPEGIATQPLGIARGPGFRDWSGFDKDEITGRDIGGGKIVPDPHAISYYLQDFGRLAGFRFMTGPKEEVSALEDATANAIKNHPHYDMNDRGVYMPNTPDAINRQWYGLGRYEILYHEIGHAIHYRVFGKQAPPAAGPVHDEMMAASQEYRPLLWGAQPHYTGKPTELMADSIAAWLSNPARRAKMPNFTRLFGKKLQPYLDMANQALPVRGAGGGWEKPEMEQPAAPPSGAGGKPPPPPRYTGQGEPPRPEQLPPPPGQRLSTENLEDVMHDIVGEPGLPPSAFNVDKMYRQFVSELGPAMNVDKLLAAEGMTKPGDNAMNTEDMFRQTYGSAQRAGYFVRYGTLDPLAFDKSGQLSIGRKSEESFFAAYDLAKKAGGTAKGFDAYRIAKRTVEKANQGIETGVDVVRASQLVGRTAEIYEPANKMLQRVKNASLDYAKDSGVFSQSQVDTIIKYNENHVTFRRIMGGDEEPLAARARGFRARDPLKRMTGSESLIMDPLTADIDNLHRVVEMADRNRAIGHVIGAVEAHATLGQDLGLKRLPDNTMKLEIAEPGSDVFKRFNIAENDQQAYEPFLAAKAFKGDKNPNRFVFFRNGKPEVWEANDPDIAALMRGADAKPQMDFFTKIATGIARFQRAGITIGPDYSSRITARHQLTAAIFDKHGGIPFSDVMSAFTDVVKQNENYQNWVANGGAGTALVDMDVNYIQRDVAHIMESTNTWNRMWNVVRHPVQFSQLLSERMDAMARLGYMKRNAPELGDLKAATQGRKAYLDYVERGTSAVAQWMAQTTPFMRPHILGVKQAYEAFTQRPLQTSAKAAMFVTLPTAALYYLNYLQDKYGNLPDDQKFENIPRWQKDTLFIAPSVGGVRLRLMMPPVVGPVFGGMTNRFLDHLVSKDAHAFENWGHSVLAELIPPVIPQVALPVTEAITNWNFFGQHSLIPGSLEENSGPMQYTENTSEPAKALARVLGAAGITQAHLDSPVVLENFVREWAGTGGVNALKALNAPFGSTGAPWTVGDIPFVQSFVIRNPGMGAEPIQRFYDEMKDFRAAHADLATAMDRAALTGDTAELQRYAANPQAYMNMLTVARALKMQHETIIAINHNDKMTDDEKRQFTDNAYSGMIHTAIFGVQLMDSINAAR